MFRSPLMERLLFRVGMVALACVCEPLRAQNGFTVQERSGLALIKPQPWSKDNEVTVFEFQAFTDRRAVGSPNAGYYEFQTAHTPKRQVAAGKVVQVVVYPTSDQIPRVMTPEERAVLANLAREIDQTIKTFPMTKSYLEPYVKELAGEVARYDGGQVKVDGKWVQRAAFEKDMADKLAATLRATLMRADPPSSFDLENDPSFIGLKQLAATNPAVKAVAESIRKTYTERVRAEKRAGLLARLNSPHLDITQARAAVDQLRNLEPAEDPKSVDFLKKWDAGAATVQATQADAGKLAAEMDAQMAQVPKEQTNPPSLSPELSKEISDLNEKMNAFLASKPPQPLIAESSLALAICQIDAGLQKLPGMFSRKEFLPAKDLLDTLVRKSRSVGPETERVLTGIQVYASGVIEEFNRRREEGNLLADAGKNAEALASYEAALAVLPDEGLAARVDELKKAVEKPKQ